MKVNVKTLTGAAGLGTCAFLFNSLVYYGGRILSRGFVHRSLETDLDRAIPLIPWTILIYLGCYLFWAVNYMIGILNDRDNRFRFLAAHVFGEAIGFFFFVFYPTTMIRPEVNGSSFFHRLLQMTYRLDSADNLMPSFHCFVSWMCWIGVRNRKDIPKWYSALSLFLAIAVCISTLTVKQHVLADVATGILFAEVSYLLAGRIVNVKKKRGDHL